MISTSLDRLALTLLSQGFIHKEIAAQMGVCPKTINNRMARLRRRFQARTSAQLVRLAIERKELL